MSATPWFTPDFPELVARREPIPGVERLQTTYVRYKRFHEAQVAQQGWDLHLSRRNYEHMLRTEGEHFVGLDNNSVYFTQLAPEAVNVKIVEAPAEFAVPVKQDRRLAPSFKVRVDVKYRSAVSFPLSVKAYVLSQQEKDDILNWQPEPLDQDAPKPTKPVTDLKGTLCITHHFESPGADNMQYNNSAASQQQQQQQQQQLDYLYGGPASSTAQSTASRGGLDVREQQQAQQRLLQVDPQTARNLNQRSQQQVAQQQHQQQQQQQQQGFGQINQLTSINQLSTLNQLALLTGGDFNTLSQAQQALLEGNGGAFTPNFLLNLFGDQADMKLVEQVSGFGFGGGGGGMGGLNLQQQLLLQQQQQAQAQQQAAQVRQLQLNGAMGGSNGLRGRVSGSGSQLGAAPLSSVGSGVPGLPTVSSQQGGGQGGQAEMHHLVQDFEFANLEFVRPTRMNKVYIVFACTILDLDTLFVVFNVPTIGICRAEQREKACQKLGIAFSTLSHFDQTPNVKVDPMAMNMLDYAVVNNIGGMQSRKREAAQQVMPQQQQQAQDEEDSESHMPGRPLDLNMSGLPAMGHGPGDGDVGMAHPRSRMAMREWIQDEYDSTGLSRKLSHVDMQAVLSQAGFPMDASSEHASISQTQWDEFCTQFRRVLSLLRQIAPVWNLEDPCVISGFDMDRMGTIAALRSEPAGTFICRFSMSQPGCLVLSCKVAPGHPKADNDGLIQAIIKIDDLYERRVDTWIRDFAGATHLLDVYRHKRVDKRKVFASNYMRLRGLDMEAGMLDPHGIPVLADV